jgi:hypothetical protein
VARPERRVQADAHDVVGDNPLVDDDDAGAASAYFASEIGPTRRWS